MSHHFGAYFCVVRCSTVIFRALRLLCLLFDLVLSCLSSFVLFCCQVGAAGGARSCAAIIQAAATICARSVVVLCSCSMCASFLMLLLLGRFVVVRRWRRRLHGADH